MDIISWQSIETVHVDRIHCTVQAEYGPMVIRNERGANAIAKYFMSLPLQKLQELSTGLQ